jgi:disulfide bond formation protein DsbB
LWSALAAALAALAGSLVLSLGMGLKACPLCFYQRTFVMSLVAVLGIGLLAGLARTGKLGLLALPLAVAGLGVAVFHVSLEMRDKLECPAGVFGLGTAPQQSLAWFVVLVALLGMDAARNWKAGGSPRAAWIGGLVLGVFLAVASCISNPPLPEAPPAPYAKAPDSCRPPFRAN